jgi:glyoxalase/bleomycin resistance protein/dioxygenase superfamily protein
MQSATKSAEIMQVGIVVRDMQEAMKAYERMLGWGPWEIYVQIEPEHYGTWIGDEDNSVPYSMQIATTQAGSIWVELIEPLEGPSQYKEFLETHGEGLHHLLLVREGEPKNALFEELRGKGLPLIMGGKVGKNVEYQYLDARRELKTIVECFSGDIPQPTYVYPAPNGAGAEVA